MSELNTNTISVDYAFDENAVAAQTAQTYTEVDIEDVDTFSDTQANAAEDEVPSTGSGSDITIDMSTETQQAIDAIKAKIANFRSLLNTTAYTTVKNKAIETIDYYKSQFDNGNTDSYNCVQIVDEYPLEIINSYYLELNYLLENYDKVQNFLAELTGNIADLKINNINRTLNNLEEDYNNLKEITEETSELTQAIIDSFSKDNIVSPDEQLTLKLKLDEIIAEYASISTSVHALIAAYEEANTPKVDENSEEHKEAFIAEDVAEYLEKLTNAFEDYQINYDNAYRILTYYTNEATERDEFGNISITPEYNLNDLTQFYEVRQKLLDIYYEANSYYTTYNRFGSKTTWIGKNGIYSGTIMADNLRGWCIQGLTVQSGDNEELPTDLEWYKYNGKEATEEADAFTKITADYRDENGNPVTKGPTWQIYKDGTGHLAKGGIRWNKDEVIFGDNTKISIKREDGTSELVPLGKNFSDLDDKIDDYISEWQDDNIISYAEQRSMSSIATEINAEYRQVTKSTENLINNLREAQDKIDDDTTDSAIETYINSLDITEYHTATNKALEVIAYYTKEDPEGTFRSVTGSVEISADYPLTAISDYYDARETLVEKYNKAADFYTNNINTILSGVIKEVKLNKDTIQGYIDTWASDELVSPAELAEFRILYNIIKSEKADIILKVQKLDEQYAEYIANIDDANIALKNLMNTYKASLDYTSYTVEADDVLNTLNYYIKYKASEEDINTYGEGFIPINTEYPLEDLYEYYEIKDALVKNYNNAFAVYTTYTNADLVNRINDLSKTNENIDKFIEDWADNNNVDPAEQVQMSYIAKEITAEAPVLKAAAAVTLENVLDVEKIIINNDINDDILINFTAPYKNALDINVATSNVNKYDAKMNAALDVISYYTSSTDGSFIDIVANKPLSAIDDYYTEREALREIINNANSFCISFNSDNITDLLGKLSDTNEKITSYIEAWLDDNGIDPAEQTEMEYIGKEIIAETQTLITAAALSISNLAAVEKKIVDSEMTEDDELLTNIEDIKKRLDSTAFAEASSAAQRVINYYVNGKKDSNGFIAFNEKYPLDDIDNYYTERENLTQAVNEADSLCQTYNDIAISNVIGGLSDTDKKISEYIATWKDDKLISPAERNELGRILSEILVEETGIIASVKDMNDKLNDILTTDGDKIGTDIKYEINEIIDTLDTTAFKTAADNAEIVLQYYTTTANIEDNGFIKIIEDQKLEVVETYYKEREDIKNKYNVALSFYNAYNKYNINILNKDLEDYAKKMHEFIDAVTSDGFIDANERRQFQIYRAEIASDSRSLDAAASSLRNDLNALAATTGNMYITEINKHLDAINIGILGYAESALATLDYYINATPDKNNLVKIDGANNPLDSINRYYSKAAELNGALNAASSFHARTVGDYANKKITIAQENLARLETDLRKLENLQGTNNEEVNNWIKAWIDEGTLNSEELKELRLKCEDIEAEYSIVNPAIQNTINWLNAHKNDTINNGEINKYLNDLNAAHNRYINAFNTVKNAVDYYLGNEAIKDPDTGCVQISDAHPLDVFSVYVSARENAVTINNEASTFVTTYNRFGSKLTKLTDDGIYTGTLSADKIDGWCLRGLTFQSAESSKTQLPNNVKWYEYHPEADNENNAFTEHRGGGDAPRWQLYKDGSGYVADGQISWEGDAVTLGDKVTLKWANVDGGKDYVDGQNNAVNERINTLNTELNKLDTQVSILSNLTGGSTSVLNEFIEIWTSDEFIDSNEIAQISKEYNQLNAEYNKVIGIAENLNDRLQEAADRTKLDPDDADYLPYPAEDFTNDTVDLKNLEDLYGKAEEVYEYYTNPENLVKDEEGNSKGYVLRDARYDINTFATYYAEQTDVVSKCNVGLSNLQQHTRFGSKFTYIGSDGIYSGSIAADQITGLVTTSTAAQSSKEDVLPKDLVWYEKTEDGEFKEIIGDGETKGPLWQLWAEGSGHLAKGNINWDAAGNINVGNIAFINNSGDGTITKYKINDTEIVKFYANAQSTGNTTGNDLDKTSFDNLCSKYIETASGNANQKSYMTFMGVYDNWYNLSTAPNIQDNNVNKVAIRNVMYIKNTEKPVTASNGYCGEFYIENGTNWPIWLRNHNDTVYPFVFNHRMTQINYSSLSSTYYKSDFMILLPAKSVFKFTLIFDSTNNFYKVTPISNIIPYKYADGSLWGYNGRGQSSWENACPYVVANYFDSNSFDLYGASYQIDVNGFANDSWWGTTSGTTPNMKHVSFAIKRQNPSLGCSIFIHMSPNPFMQVINSTGLKLNQAISLTDASLTEKAKWVNMYHNSQQGIAVSIYAKTGSDEVYTTYDSYNNGSILSTVQIDGYEYCMETSKVLPLKLTSSDSMITVNGLQSVTLNARDYHIACPGIYYRDSEYYTKYWQIDIPDGGATASSDAETITVHVHIGKFLLYYLYNAGITQLTMYASIANSLGIPVKELQIPITLYDSSNS